MKRKRSIRIPALALAATLALAAPAAAAPWTDSPADWLARAWQRLMVSLWGEEGSAMDPNGRSPANPKGSSSLWGEEGGAMDPDGKPIPRPGPSSIWGEEGSEMDPNGRAPAPRPSAGGFPHASEQQ